MTFHCGPESFLQCSVLQSCCVLILEDIKRSNILLVTSTGLKTILFTTRGMVICCESEG